MTLLILPLDIKIFSYLCSGPKKSEKKKTKTWKWKFGILGFLPGFQRNTEDRKNKYSVCDLEVVGLPQ